jgi:hypothetical protein
MPPVGWGTSNYRTWEERVAAWRARPAKERLACIDRRQVQDPTMPEAASMSGCTIRWSNGHGVWPSHGYYDHHCFKRGYWVRTDPYGSPNYIGETIDDVTSYLENRLFSKLTELKSAQEWARTTHNNAIKSIERFEHEVLGPKVLDLLSELRPTAVVEPS